MRFFTPYSGPEEAQRLERFWPLHHSAFKILNLSIKLTCHVIVHFMNYCVFLCCVLCILLIMIIL